MKTHELAVEKVLLDHDDVDCLGILECEEAKATRTTSSAVAHDLTVDHLAEL